MMRGRGLRVLLALGIGPSLPAAGSEWSLDWWTIDGGGEMFAEDGSWQLSGTIGQWDATASPEQAASAWELTGGFWGATAETGTPLQDGFEG